jgi:transglutaminase-like putative cysteine protease
MRLRTSCDLVFDIAVPTPFILMLRPRSGSQQWIAREEYRLIPTVQVHEFTDQYGNLCQRLIAQPGNFEIHTVADVLTTDEIQEGRGVPFVEIQDLPDAVLVYLLPSRYCESEHFGELAQSVSEGLLPGYDQVAAIEDWVRRTIRFEPGSSDLPVSASEVNARRYGVCRDLAHLGIALCRSLSIPARMVVGYLNGLEPMDMHAWFEAYIGGHWYRFDATRSAHSNGYVAIGYGRDAADVAVYTQFGPAVYPVAQEVRVERLE